MKVLHVIPSLDPATGGPPVISASLASAQAAQGCQIQLISYRFPSAQARIDAALQSIPASTKVQWDYLPPLTKPERFLARGARRRLTPIVAAVDLVHLHGVWDPLIYAAASVAVEQKKPFVLTLHGMLHPWALKQRGWKKQLALTMGYRRMLNQAAWLHLGNVAEQALTAGLNLTPPTRIISNGVFPQEFEPLPTPGKFRAAYPQLAQAKMVLFLSRLHYMKGLDILAKAFALVAANIPDARLVVAGPDVGAQADFETAVRHLGIGDRVHLVGPLYGADKLAALRDCDCFCLPSRREGFSMAVLEAMACEAPVVISTECYFPEVKEHDAGIIAELNPSEIAAGIEVILHDPQRAKQMGQRGRELVYRQYTWPNVARQMIEGYHAALNPSPVT
jgi:glycosyltransferase involved in cell wall biosynthesis